MMTRPTNPPGRPRRGGGTAPQTRDASSTMPPPRAVTVTNYRADPLYSRIVRATDAILKMGKVVRPIDVLVGMGLLTPAQLADWYAGRTPYLERVIAGNLKRLSRLLRILRFHAHELKLMPSFTAYRRHGSRAALRFTKTGDANLEKVYATHFIWPGKQPLHERAENDST